MLVYGDVERSIGAQRLRREIEHKLEVAAELGAGLPRHTALVDAFLETGALVGGLLDRQMRALEPFDVTLTFCFTPESRGLAPHYTSPPREIDEFAAFCADQVRRYA